MDRTRSEPPADTALGRAGQLVQRMSDDLKVIARDELALGRIELAQTMKHVAADAVATLLAGVVALIGLGLLCLCAVAALSPLIPALWLRLLLMALVYLGLGGSVAAVFAKRVKRDVEPTLPRAKSEAQRTIEAVREELRHA